MLISVANQPTQRSVESLAATIIFKAMAKRDMSKQETSTHIHENELYESDGNVVTLSLGDEVRYFQGNLQAKTNFQKYLNRGNEDVPVAITVRNINGPTNTKIITKRVSELNFMEFYTQYSDAFIKGEKMHLQTRRNKDKLVIQTIPDTDGNPNGKYYSQYCEYSLRKFKPVSEEAINLLDEESDKQNPQPDDWIRTWKKFVES